MSALPADHRQIFGRCFTDEEQKSPADHRAIDFSLLGRRHNDP